MASKRNGGAKDLTIAVLREIRDEIRTLRQDTNARFEGARLEERFSTR